MLISDKYNFIFIHVPKNAGTSIYNALLSNSNYTCRFQKSKGVYYLKRILGRDRIFSAYNKHITISELHNKLGENINSYHTFAVVRNPYDRLVSRYFYFKNTHGNYEFSRYHHIMSFDQFVNGLQKNTWKDLQSYYVCNGDKIGVDQVLRFEQLETDWKQLMEMIGLKNISLGLKNRSERDSNFMKYYDSETISKVNEIYKRDFELFDYQMIDT